MVNYNYKAVYSITGEKEKIFKEFPARDDEQARDFAEFEAISIATNRRISFGRVTLDKVVRINETRPSEQTLQPSDSYRPAL